MSDRERALRLLQRLAREPLFATALLHDESGFVRTLVLGVLRWRSRLDFIIAALARRPLAKLDPEIIDILRLGLFQILFAGTAHHAAVSETVDLVASRQPHARGLVNAILRRATRGDSPEPPDTATRLAHPEWLLARWEQLFGKERAAAIAAANQELSHPDVLLLRGEPPAEGIASSFAEGIWKLDRSTADLDRARFYPMDEGSAVIASIAAATSSDVLDLAAAPGGKSLFMRERGTRVVSNDLSLTRLLPLHRYGGSIVAADGRRPPYRRRFQTVLLDAPCSATGTIRKNPELKWRLRETDLASFASLQRELLEAALALSERYVVYATCSLEPEENDDVVHEAKGFSIRDIAPLVPGGARRFVEGQGLRLTPESGTDGFTAFVLERD